MTIRNPVRALFIGAIRGYQMVISPGLPGRCKFYPSCSQYTLEAVKEYGAVRGTVLGAWRILRCNPLSYGGYDPVARQKLFATHDHRHCPTGLQ
jgi:putative membrane protein insertion efficiency factor